MPWKETSALEERVRFVMECERGELPKAELCRRLGISRETGYKWLARYRASGVDGLRERSRAPCHHPNAVSEEMVQRVLQARGQHPTWGPRKLRAWLARQQPAAALPATSTLGEILHRHGLTVPRRRKRRATAYAEPLAHAGQPNAVWCMDFKGWFRTGDGRRCDPLTISDAASRYLLRCQALAQPQFEPVRRVCDACFREHGLPAAIRTDNGPPFASCALGGLSRLAVWWIKLGIVPERITPGHPEENGRHERMHLTLKRETASPPGRSLRAQQRMFDRFRAEYNNERPHEALGQQPPASRYEPSAQSYPRRVCKQEYASHMQTRRVQKRGVIYWSGHKVFLSEALVGERVGLEPVDGRHWTIYFGSVALAQFDAADLTVSSLARSSGRARDR